MNTSKSLEQLLVQLVEDCHGIVHEQFMGQIDKNPAFDKTAAAIVEAVEGLINSMYEMGITDLELRQHQTGEEAPVISKTDLMEELQKWKV